MKDEFILDKAKLKKGASVIRAVNHELRQKILKLIHHNGRITVTEIYKKLGLDQSTTSQHLAILRKADCVVTERDGQLIFYSVNYQRLKQIHRTLDDIISEPVAKKW